jgi:hypothetical protein
MSDHRCLISFLLTIGLVAICSGCADVSKKQPVVAVRVQECGIGDSCVFRQDVRSALVFTNWNAYRRFLRAKIALPGDDFKWYSDPEAKGDMAILLAGSRIRVVRGVDRGVEAMVEADTYHPAPDGIGMVGIKITGQKIWLEGKLAPLSRWQKAM